MISISIIYYFIQKNNDRPNPASQQTNCASGGSPRFPVANSRVERRVQRAQRGNERPLWK